MAHIGLAIENMRKSGAIKAAKSRRKFAADGVTKTKNDGNVAFHSGANRRD